jgi:hypothetical protein
LVECLLPKQNVVGSSPITRSKTLCIASKMTAIGRLFVRQTQLLHGLSPNKLYSFMIDMT